MKLDFEALTLIRLQIAGSTNLYAIYLIDGFRSEQLVFTSTITGSAYQKHRISINSENLIGFVNRGGSFINQNTSSYCLILASDKTTSGTIYPRYVLGSVDIGSLNSYLYLGSNDISNPHQLTTAKRSPDWSLAVGRAFLQLSSEGAINLLQLFSSITSPAGSSIMTITIGADATTPQAYPIFSKSFTVAASTAYGIFINSVMSESAVVGQNITLNIGDLSNIVSGRWAINIDFDVGTATPIAVFSMFDKYALDYFN
jgi:hypothetical protein